MLKKVHTSGRSAQLDVSDGCQDVVCSHRPNIIIFERSRDGRNLPVFLAEYLQQNEKLSIRIKSFVGEDRKGSLTTWVLDSEHDLARTGPRPISLKPSFAMEQELQCPTVQLLQFEAVANSQ
jgi:hypothetical protein